MQNFVGKGDKITITADASGLSGAPVVLEDRVGIAEHEHAVGDDLVVLLEGLVELDRAAETWAAGEKVYWDVADGNATNDADTGTNKPLGWAANDYASTVTSGVVKLGAY